jgi:hypothetical protein
MQIIQLQTTTSVYKRNQIGTHRLILWVARIFAVSKNSIVNFNNLKIINYEHTEKQSTVNWKLG